MELVLQEGGGGEEGGEGGLGDGDHPGSGVFQLCPDHLPGEVWVGHADPGPDQPSPEDRPVELQAGAVGRVEDVAQPEAQLVQAACHYRGGHLHGRDHESRDEHRGGGLLLGDERDVRV